MPLPTERPALAQVGAVATRLSRAARRHPIGLRRQIVAAAAEAGMTEATVWLADLQERVLVPFVDGGAGEAAMTIDGTLAGRAWRDRVPLRTDDGATWVPLADGARTIGVLGGYTVDWGPEVADGLAIFGSVAAEVLVSSEAVSDEVLKARRLRPMSLPAEVQWGLLPPAAVAAGGTVVCGALEPAYDIGGDSFDYAVNGRTAHLALFDAMGHGLSASMMVSIAVAAYRHARRAGQDLQGCYTNIDQAISIEFGPDRFVTGLLAQLDLDAGHLSYLVAGHHPALLLRSGRVVRHLDGAIRLPFGLGAGIGPLPLVPDDNIGTESLEPADRVLLYTDGIIEARDTSGDFFGLDRLEELLVRADASATPAPETLRRLIHAVLEHQADQLQDDATLLMAEWNPEESAPVL